MERGDLERLVDSYGKVVEVDIFKNHAILTLECGRQQAEEAIKALDRNFWMDNSIRVMFNKNQKTSEKELSKLETVKNGSEEVVTVNRTEGEEVRTISGLEKTKRTFNVFCNFNGKTFLQDMCELFSMFGVVDSSKWNIKTKTVTLELRLTDKEVEWCLSGTNDKMYKNQPLRVKLVDPPAEEQSLVDDESSAIPETFKDEKKVTDRTLIAYCNTTAKTFLSDMSNVVFPKFGTIKSCRRNPDGKTISIVMYSSELDAVRCISETNNITYKGQSLRVKFEDGSLEDSAAFRRQYLDLFHNYPTELIPAATRAQPVQPTASVTSSANSLPELPIGVLPPSSSLGAFGALPGLNHIYSYQTEYIGSRKIVFYLCFLYLNIFGLYY